LNNQIYFTKTSGQLSSQENLQYFLYRQVHLLAEVSMIVGRPASIQDLACHQNHRRTVMFSSVI
jgi:hypothetical protein